MLKERNKTPFYLFVAALTLSRFDTRNVTDPQNKNALQSISDMTRDIANHVLKDITGSSPALQQQARGQSSEEEYTHNKAYTSQTTNEEFVANIKKWADQLQALLDVTPQDRNVIRAVYNGIVGAVNTLPRVDPLANIEIPIDINFLANHEAFIHAHELLNTKHDAVITNPPENTILDIELLAEGYEHSDLTPEILQHVKQTRAWGAKIARAMGSDQNVNETMDGVLDEVFDTIHNLAKQGLSSLAHVQMKDGNTSYSAPTTLMLAMKAFDILTGEQMRLRAKAKNPDRPVTGLTIGSDDLTSFIETHVTRYVQSFSAEQLKESIEILETMAECDWGTSRDGFNMITFAGLFPSLMKEEQDKRAGKTAGTTSDLKQEETAKSAPVKTKTALFHTPKINFNFLRVIAKQFLAFTKLFNKTTPQPQQPQQPQQPLSTSDNLILEVDTSDELISEVDISSRREDSLSELLDTEEPDSLFSNEKEEQQETEFNPGPRGRGR